MQKNKKIVYRAVKRLFDIIFAIIGCVLLIPLTVIVKICYVLSGDFKSVFYRQDRVGLHGKKIRIFKFRSMVKNADDVLKELLKDPQRKREWELNQKLDDDPRITKVGKILRKCSLDEVPQFINVLIGDMSLVGPRPLVEGELEAHGGNPEIYRSVRPGITGWWAANGRSALSYEDRLSLEMYYAQNCSILLDIKCIFKTISAVLFKRGAK